MGSLTTGVGLISGIDTASLIESLITLQSRGKVSLQRQVAGLQAQQAALIDINARLLSLKSAAQGFRLDDVFNAAVAKSSDEETLAASATGAAQPGSYQFIVKQLVSSSQKLSRGYADRDTTPLGLERLSFELGKGGVSTDAGLADLNGGNGVDRGKIVITDRSGASSTIDLGDVTTLDEVLDRINDDTTIDVTASIDGDRLVITDNTGLTASSLTIANGIGDTTATDLGIAGTAADTVLTGTDINYVGASTSLQSLNDGLGVLVRDNVDDLQITARDGTAFGVDLGRVDAPIESSTLLSELNNGAGITLSDDAENPDLTIVARDGTEFEVDLTGLTTVGGLISRISNETSGQIALSISASGDGFTVTDTVGGSGNLIVRGAGDNGTATAEDLGILNETGVAADSFDGEAIPNTISAAPVVTIQNVLDRINGAEGNDGRVVASLGDDGVSLKLVDTTGSSVSDLIVASTAGNPDAAADLGLAGSYAAATLDGDRLIAGLNSVLVRNLNGGAGLDLPEIGDPQTLTGGTRLADLFSGTGLQTNGDAGSIDIRIRDRDGTDHDVELDGLTTVQDLIDAVETASGGNVVVTIEDDALRFTDTTGGTGNFRIQNRNGATVATQLDIAINDPVDTVLSTDTEPIYTTADATLDITNRLGVSTQVDVSAATSVQDILNLINASGAGVIASLNSAGNGLKITDDTAGTGNLVIAGTAAASLGLTADVAGDEVSGENLQHKYVGNASRLDDLNYGRGIGLGTFRITDGTGASEIVDIGSDSQTLYDVVNEINSRGLAIVARVNDNGDGLLIEDDPAADPLTLFTPIKVESVSGSTARDLGILGTADEVATGSIDGSYERVIDVTVSDTLDEIVAKINEANVPVSATVLNTGSGATPFRLNFASGITGRDGELIIDSGDVDLGLTTLQQGRDAKVFFGSTDPAEGFLLTSASNSLVGVVPGLTIDLLAASEEAVTITVDRDTETIIGAVEGLVTALNDVLSTIDGYDFFDTETEERGVLLGNSLSARIKSTILKTVQQRGETGSSYQYLNQVGISIGSDSTIEFDRDRFEQAYADDPDAVKSLFADLETTTVANEEISPGITVPGSSQTTSSRGFGELIKELSERLTNSVDGTLTLASRGYDDRIEVLNDRIADFDLRLEAKRERLQQQFNAMELALARLQDQSGALQLIASNAAAAQASSSGFGG